MNGGEPATIRNRSNNLFSQNYRLTIRTLGNGVNHILYSKYFELEYKK